MNTLNKILLILGLLTFHNILPQSNNILSYTDNSTIRLRWSGVHTGNISGYTVYRKLKGESDWNRLNRRLIKPEFQYKDLERILGFKIDAYMSLFGLDAKKKESLTQEQWIATFSKKGAESMLGAMSIINPEYALAMGEMYIDDDVKTGQTYQYKVAVVDSKDQEVQFFISTEIDAGKLEKIPVVQELRYEVLDGSVILSWKKNSADLKSGKLASWKVMQSKDELGPWEQVNHYGILPMKINGTESSADREAFHVQFLQNGQKYYFKVIPYNAFGIEGNASVTVECIPVAKADLTPPSGFNVVMSGNVAKLSWSENKSVAIYKSAARGEFKQVFPPINTSLSPTTMWIDSDVKEGENYRYFLRSYSSALQFGPPGDTIYWDFPDITPPPSPVGIAVNVVKGGIRITWEAVTATDLLGYDIERSSDAVFSSRYQLNKKPITSTAFTDSLNEKTSTTFSYIIYATDRSYNRSAPSKPVYLKLPDKIPPARPLILELKEHDSGITVRWEPGPDLDIDKYKVYSRLKGNQNWTLLSETGTSTYVDRRQLSGIWEFSVLATDSSKNESVRSNVVGLTVIGLNQLSSPVNGKIEKVEGNLILTWQKAPGSNPEGFIITRIADGKRLDVKQVKRDQFFWTDHYPTRGKLIYEIRSRNAQWQMGKPLIIEYDFKE